jgi:hypothetical protein
MPVSFGKISLFPNLLLPSSLLSYFLLLNTDMELPVMVEVLEHDVRSLASVYFHISISRLPGMQHAGWAEAAETGHWAKNKKTDRPGSVWISRQDGSAQEEMA